MSFGKQLNAWFNELSHNLVTQVTAFLSSAPGQGAAAEKWAFSTRSPCTTLLSSELGDWPHHLSNAFQNSSEFSIHWASPASITKQHHSTSNSLGEPNGFICFLNLAKGVLLQFQKLAGIIKERGVNSTWVGCQEEDLKEASQIRKHLSSSGKWAEVTSENGLLFTWPRNPP